MRRVVRILEAQEISPLLREFARDPAARMFRFAHPPFDRLPAFVHALHPPPVRLASIARVHFLFREPPVPVTRQVRERVQPHDIDLPRPGIRARDKRVAIAFQKRRGRPDPQHRRLRRQTQFAPCLRVRAMVPHPCTPLFDEWPDTVIAEHLDMRDARADRAAAQRIVTTQVTDQLARPDRNTRALRIVGPARRGGHHHPVERRIRQDLADQRSAVFLAQMNPSANRRGR
ncbi:hypothetical protein LMG29739_06357 [Paraburkholderia solisilvae]|uniref:Uncharacterized protein n=1 Tax=Paraburkholderia solisilvae TaxID=624376 RepID=A0A6J5F3R6_9BURK|nr:hypothetical protein LMG29739_06357 [Paraburkholderia solisilvae]